MASMFSESEGYVPGRIGRKRSLIQVSKDTLRGFVTIFCVTLKSQKTSLYHCESTNNAGTSCVYHYSSILCAA